MYWFTSDFHLGHQNILKYCNRPFDNVEEMDGIIIENMNKTVNHGDTIIHVGDFTLMKNRSDVHRKYISKLRGHWIFIAGSHDHWLNRDASHIWSKSIQDKYIVACHYAMRVWPRSHYGSILVYGHSHGHLESFGRSLDVGVDTNNFYPYSSDDVIELTKNKKNFNELEK